MLYTELFSVDFQHRYFTNNVFTGFRVVPTEDTAALFKTHKLLFKVSDHGFQLYSEGSGAEKEYYQSVLQKENKSLVFTVYLKDTDFFNYTGNMPPAPADWLFWFSNLDSTQQQRNTNLLHTGDYVSAQDTQPALHSKAPAPAPAGFIEICVNEKLPQKIFICFAELHSYWRYVLASEWLQTINKPAIIDKANAYLFSGPEMIDLPDNKKAPAFTSAGPVAMSQGDSHWFSLVEEYDPATTHAGKTVIGHLPVPGMQTDAAPYGANDHISTIMLF